MERHFKTMKNNLLRNMYAAIVALFVTSFVLPQQLQAENYNLLLNGKRVTSENCGDLTAIEGVKGKVTYDATSNVLTLENATISNASEKAAGVALWNSIKNLTIKLVGENSITSEKSGGVVNYEKLTFTGTGKLTIKGVMSSNTDYSYGILNPGTIIVDGCTMEISGGVNGITSVPEFTDCKIVSPEGTVWKELNKSGYKFQSLFGADGKVVTDWVTIKPNTAPEKYNLLINGKQVTSENCSDLTAIEGVKGKVTYDATSNVLTLENATISNASEKAAGVALWNSIKNLTIKLVGENTITSEKSGGIVNYDKLTFAGTGKLTVEYKGSMGRLNVIPEFTDCKIVSPEGTVWKELNKSGYKFQSLFGADGKVVTDWVTIQSNDAPVTYDLVLEAVGDRDIAVIAIVKDITGMGMMAVKKLIETAPCMIKENMTEADAKDARDKLLAVGATANIYPHGTWKKPTGINIQTVDAADQTIYNLQGVRINAKFENLPAGVYIVNGKKVLKK